MNTQTFRVLSADSGPSLAEAQMFGLTKRSPSSETLDVREIQLPGGPGLPSAAEEFVLRRARFLTDHLAGGAV
jgi:hypothetical protein